MAEFISLKECRERALALCDDIDMALSGVISFKKYDIKHARHVLWNLAKCWAQATGSFKGFPQEVFPEEPKSPEGHWIAVPAYDNGVHCGYQVRWSEQNERGLWLFVGHYFTDFKPGDPSLGWCQNAAERHAQRFNQELRAPWEWEHHFNDDHSHLTSHETQETASPESHVAKATT